VTTDDLITSAEAATILDVDRSTLTRWSDPKVPDAERRLTPVLRAPGSTGAKFFRRADVERLRDEMAEATA